MNFSSLLEQKLIGLGAVWQKQKTVPAGINGAQKLCVCVCVPGMKEVEEVEAAEELSSPSRALTDDIRNASKTMEK